MTREIVLFGAGKIGQVLRDYLARDPRYSLAAVTVEDAYVSGDACMGLPLVPFSRVREAYPPERYAMLVAMGYHDMNAARARVCGEAKALGYALESYVDPAATVFDSVELGENCIVLDHAVLQPHTSLGDGACVFSGAVVAHHSRVEPYCWLTSGSVVGGNSVLGAGSFLGMGAIIGHNIRIGRENFIGASAVVTRSTQDEEVHIVPDTPKYRLTSRQFLKFTRFD